MDYLDFEVEIGFGSGNEYPVSVIHSVAGEAREIMQFPFDDLALENQLLALQNALLRSGGKRRLILSPEDQAVQRFGLALFNMLFVGEVRTLYVASQHEALYQGKGLRLKLRILSPKLAALPWEFLYDPRQAEYVCLSSNTPIVRYIELPHPPPPLQVALPFRILGMIVSPKDLPDLDVERERQRIEKATEYLRSNGLVELTWLQGRTWQELQRTIRRGSWHVFHFIGHGCFNSNTDEGLIALEDDDGRAANLRATHLARLLTDHRSLRLVVLNSCEGARGSNYDIFSSTAGILIQRGIPAVLAMQYEITDIAAIELSRVFYEALAEGVPVDTALAEARKAISIGITNTVEWGTPVLYMRSPDGILFDLRRQLSVNQFPSLSSETHSEQIEHALKPTLDESLSLALQLVKKNWESIKKRIKTKKDGAKIAAVLNGYTIVDVEGTVELPIIILKALADFHYKCLQKDEYRKVIEWALKIELEQECYVQLLPPGSSDPRLSIPPIELSGPAKPKRQQYESGDRVCHTLFGEGIVVKSTLEMGTEFVTVQFASGEKLLSMDFARLEKR